MKSTTVTEVKKKRRAGNGTKDAVSRYSQLKANFDNNLFNNHWFDVDTKKVSSKKSQYNVVDLFAGAGGMSEGFRQAGFNNVLSVELEKDASNTLRKNFPEAHHFEGKIEDLSNEEIKKIVGIVFLQGCLQSF